MHIITKSTAILPKCSFQTQVAVALPQWDHKKLLPLLHLFESKFGMKIWVPWLSSEKLKKGEMGCEIQPLALKVFT